MLYLENPIRQGQSQYYSVIAQYDIEKEVEIDVNLTGDIDLF